MCGSGWVDRQEKETSQAPPSGRILPSFLPSFHSVLQMSGCVVAPPIAGTLSGPDRGMGVRRGLVPGRAAGGTDAGAGETGGTRRNEAGQRRDGTGRGPLPRIYNVGTRTSPGHARMSVSQSISQYTDGHGICSIYMQGLSSRRSRKLGRCRDDGKDKTGCIRKRNQAHQKCESHGL